MKKKNEAILSEVEEKLKESKYVVFVDYRGLDVNEINILRRELKRSLSEFKVIKNTISSILLKNLGIEGINDYLTGPTAITFCMKDEITPSKILTDFAKEHEGLKIKAGLLNKKILNADAVELIAKLPKREILLSKLLSTMQLPLSRLVFILGEPIRHLDGVITAKIQSNDK